MAVTFSTKRGDHSDNPVWMGGNNWRVIWTSSLGADTPCRVFVDGQYVRTTRAQHVDLSLEDGRSATVEVLDDLVTQPQLDTSPFVELRWPSVPKAKRYRVEQLIAAVWTVIGEVANKPGGELSYRLPALPGSSTDHDFRVTTIGDDDNESTATGVKVTMVKRPDPPSVSVTFSNATKRITIAAAA